MPKIDKMVPTGLDQHLQVIQAYQLREEMRSSALTALIEPLTALRFVDRHPVLSVQAASTKLGTQYAGVPLAVEARKLYSQLEDPRFPDLKDGCFVAGTPVWTDKGLVPIEQIKVGDMVLSQPEQGGERAYKRVAQTFVHEKKHIRSITLNINFDQEETLKETELLVTPNHPIWVNEAGWTDAVKLETGDMVRLADGTEGFVFTNYVVANSNIAGIGCLPQGDDGTFIDFRDGKIEYFSHSYANPRGHLEYGDFEFEAQVFNLEVEDFHTYFVGEYGVWVHNKSPSSGPTADLPTPYIFGLFTESSG